MKITDLPLLAMACAALASACASTPKIKQSQNSLYTSAYSLSDRSVAGYDLVALTDAPQRKVVMMHFDRRVSEVFMSLLSEVDRYDGAVVDVSFDHSASENPGDFGVGSVRICTFLSGKKLYEPLVAFEQDRVYAYTVDKDRSTRSLPINDVVLFYTFEDRPHATSLVTVRAHFRARKRFLAPFVNFAFGRAINKTFASAVETFGGRLVTPEP